MAFDKPSTLPRWADDPPAPSTDHVLEPSASEKDDGWPAGNPRRQFMNWLQLTTYEWLAWLDQSGYRSSDFLADQPLPGVGTAIPLSGGLSRAAADFSASVFADGYRVPETSSPAHTYTANSDHYWDLGRDCTWTVTVLATPSSEPAVTANSTRVYVATTNATDIVSVDDRRPNLLNLKEFGADQIELGRELLDTAANSALARITTPWNVSNDYVLLWETLPEVGGTVSKLRLYLDPSRKEIVAIYNASWDGTVWTRDVAAVAIRKTIIGIDSSGETTYYVNDSATPWADTHWFDDVTSALDTEKRNSVHGQVEGGTDLDNNEYERTQIARFKSNDAVAGAIQRTYHLDVGHGSLWTANFGSNAVAGGNTHSFEMVFNATYDGDSDQWSRIDLGEDAWALSLSQDGYRLYVHPASQPSPWANTESAATWVEVDAISEFATQTDRFLMHEGAQLSTYDESIISGGTPSASPNINSRLTKSGASTFELHRDFTEHLVHNATLDSLELFLTSNTGSGDLRATIFRVHRTTGASENLLSGAGYKVIPDTVDTTITPDQNNLLDLDTYRYWFWLFADTNRFFGTTGCEITLSSFFARARAYR